jgi:beta-galactosidase
MREVSKWWSVLMPRLEKHWYGNGGNIIMSQIENEYGSLNICDKKYLNFLRDETEKYVNDKAVLFTVDMPYGNALECGQVDNVFVTTDFGINSASNIENNFKRLRQVQKTGPLVNSEFYAGWFTFWHGKYQRNSAYDVAASLRVMLDMNANVNLYMFFGGTNFGFWSGANNVGLNKYVPDITSYDYDAPLDEAGDTTIKYNKIRGAISEYFKIPQVSVFPTIKKVALPSIKLTLIDSILASNSRRFLTTRPRQENRLLTFEELDQFSGFVLYETELPEFTRDPSNLVVEDLRDRAQIYVDGSLVGILSREHKIKSLPVSAGLGKRLEILVENQGRINFEVMDDYKGILGNVSIQQFEYPFYQELSNWTICGFPFANIDQLYWMIENSKPNPKARTLTGPLILHAEVELKDDDLGDTYWNTSGWGKGFLIVNGFNLGRHWPLAGPQMTLFIPKDLLKVGKNKFTIVEQQMVRQDVTMNFVDKPIFVKN